METQLESGADTCKQEDPNYFLFADDTLGTAADLGVRGRSVGSVLVRLHQPATIPA